MTWRSRRTRPQNSKPQASSANSAASRLLKNHSSDHDARYNDFAGETAAGSAGMQPYRGIAWWAHGDDHCICANILPALLPTRIGSVDPHALKTTARRTRIYTAVERSFRLHAEAAHLRLARRLVCIAARGARNERLPHERRFQSSQDRVCRRPLAAQVRHCDVHV